jgi:hypothetical protein
MLAAWTSSGVAAQTHCLSLDSQGARVDLSPIGDKI